MVNARVTVPDSKPIKAHAVGGSAPPPSSSTVASSPSAGEFFKLGVGHILGGFDHLLFLVALLVGVRKTPAMLGIVTCFTVAHSMTLAMAALKVVTISSRVVEPLIAASIIVVGLENLWRRKATADRFWLAGGFGLIHGFGFASALRETGLGREGASVAMPLFSFNLGVEAGQLLVAALLLPALFLMRRWRPFELHGAWAVSALVIAVSGYWLLERTVGFR
jgi:hydrogenase/urease accessory protein HupE